MRGAIAAIDQLIYRLLVGSKALSEERKYLQVQSQAKGETLANTSLYLLDIIDAKTQALLAHVSMMIAVLSLFATFVIKSGTAHFVLILEIIGYVVIAIGLLRCVRIIGPEMGFSTTADEYNDRIGAETCFRRRLYVTLLNATIYITVVFLIAVVAHYVAIGYATE